MKIGRGSSLEITFKNGPGAGKAAGIQRNWTFYFIPIIARFFRYSILIFSCNRENALSGRKISAVGMDATCHWL